MRQFLLLQIIEITLRWSQVKSLEPLLKLYKEPLIIYRQWGGGGGGGKGGWVIFFFLGGGKGRWMIFFFGGGEEVWWFSGEAERASVVVNNV